MAMRVKVGPGEPLLTREVLREAVLTEKSTEHPWPRLPALSAILDAYEAAVIRDSEGGWQTGDIPNGVPVVVEYRPPTAEERAAVPERTHIPVRWRPMQRVRNEGLRIAVEEAEWWLRNEAGAEGAGPMLGIGWALAAIARALEEQR